MLVRCALGVVLVVMMLAACGNAGTLPSENAAAPPPSEPPTIVGEITQTGERVLVEQQPGATIGDKIFFRLSDATRILQRVGDDLQPKTADDLAVGQRVEVWANGGVAESYPGQAGAAVIVIAEAAGAITPEPGRAAPPDREPDVVGTVTQASNTVWIDHNLVLFITPRTQFFRRSGEALAVINAHDITEGQRVEVWVDEIRYAPQPQAEAVAIVVTNN